MLETITIAFEIIGEETSILIISYKQILLFETICLLFGLEFLTLSNLLCFDLFLAQASWPWVFRRRFETYKG